MSVQGCIVADPPVFEQPEKTPPFLDLAAASPSIFEVLQQPPATRVNINVPFRSEDAGVRLQSALFLNFQTPTEDLQFVGYVAPGTISEERKISIEWSTPSLTVSACEQLTLQVTHISNFDDATNELIDKSDVGLAVWWVEVQVNGSPLLEDCPRIGGST
jgi:hypothetical protein